MTLLSPEEWSASLPSVLASGAALITDPAGNVLLVKPNYRPLWNLPGGVLDAGEAPHAACRREVREELGLDVEVGRLLSVAWRAPNDLSAKGWLGFVFDCGVLTDPGRIRLQAEELDAYAFVPPDRFAEHLDERLTARVAAALRGLRDGTAEYLA